MQSLKLEGRGIRRFRQVLIFFTLAGAVGWTGHLWITKRPGPGTLQPWELLYEGNHAREYHDLLVCTGWPETMEVDLEFASRR